MTSMRRVTIAFPDDMDKRILDLRKSDQFVRCSYSEIVRKAIDCGVKMMEQSEKTASGGD